MREGERRSIAEFAEDHDLTNSIVLKACSKLGIRAARPSDSLSTADSLRILEAIGRTAKSSRVSDQELVAERPRLLGIEVRSYRSIGRIDVQAGDYPLTIVGPNNSGKTNLLRAIELLLSNPARTSSYIPERDRTFSETGQRTGLSATFDVALRSSLGREYQQLLKRAGMPPDVRAGRVTIPLSVEFYPGRVSVRARPHRSARPDEDFAEEERSFVDELLSTFAVHYIPSVKNVRELYRELVIPAMVRTAARTLQPLIGELERELESVSTVISQVLADVGQCHLRAEVTLPDDSLEVLLGAGFDLNVMDPSRTSLYEKGHGIQSLVLLSSFLWITEDDERRGKTSVWLLEEPESYLHPELTKSCLAIINRLAARTPVFVTTHSLSFVPSRPQLLLGTKIDDSGRSSVETFPSYRSATARIRKSLGVRFSDFLHFGDYNVVVEGETDVLWLRWFIDNHFESDAGALKQAHLAAMGGAQNVRSFLEWSLEPLRRECRVVALFDGDREGMACFDAIGNLKGLKKAGLSVADHVLIGRDRFEIEALVPDVWITDLHDRQPEIFENYSTDAEGGLVSMSVNDGHKRRYFELTRRRADAADERSWANRLQGVCTKLGAAASASGGPVWQRLSIGLGALCGHRESLGNCGPNPGIRRPSLRSIRPNYARPSRNHLQSWSSIDRFGGRIHSLDSIQRFGDVDGGSVVHDRRSHEDAPSVYVVDPPGKCLAISEYLCWQQRRLPDEIGAVIQEHENSVRKVP